MWRDAYSYNLNFTGANQLLASARQTLKVDIDQKTDFALQSIAVQATSLNVRIEIVDHDSRQIIAGLTSLVNIAGHGMWPYSLRSPLILGRTNQLVVSLTDESAVNNNVRFRFSGSNLYTEPLFDIPRFVTSVPMWLPFNFGGGSRDDMPIIPANGTLPGALRTPGDSWYEVERIVICATGTTLAGGATLQIETNGVYPWFRQPLHLLLLGATDFSGAFNGAAAPNFPGAPFGFDLSPAKLLPPNTLLQLSVTDLSGINNAVRILLHGQRKRTAQQSVTS